ncbi:SDR family NAD(P)-dependent oxidoreductase, partial [Candidatus Bathyarchaeota archaeon]|nr:SDR family NAD(P)-dependent oxidoreductase [Candidatus Bathyarchaeota archaeon]
MTEGPNRMPRNRFDLAGKVAIVTGGGRGIGKAIAVGLAEHGADVVLSSRTQTQIEQVAQEIRNLGRKALPIVVDLTKMSDLARLVDGTTNAFQHIDVLVNNAGQSHEMPAELVEEKEWDSTMNVNVKAPFFLSQKVGKV